jgi:hypothetical protein
LVDTWLAGGAVIVTGWLYRPIVAVKVRDTSSALRPGMQIFEKE